MLRHDGGDKMINKIIVKGDEYHNSASLFSKIKNEK
jgi:hypothetical protein